jgi:plastocyanin
MRNIGLLLPGGLLLLVSVAHASNVQGQTSLPNKRKASNAVVYLEGAKKAAPLSKAVVDQREKTFLPHVSVVSVGTTVEFPNNDTVFHNVYAYFDSKKFDLGMYPQGAVKRVKLDKKGVIALLCNVHSEMSAYIMVVDTPYYTVTDKAGRFHIDNVPPGAYKLHVWHESGASYVKEVVVKEKNDALTLTLNR